MSERLDLRLIPVAAALWAGTLLGLRLDSGRAVIACAAAALMTAAVTRKATAAYRTVGVLVLACLVVGMLAGWSRSVQVRDGPVAELAAQEAQAAVDGVLVADPEVRQRGGGDERGPRSEYVLVRLRIDEISGRGIVSRVRVPVFVVASDMSWADLLPGQRVRASGRLSPADFADVGAFFRVRDEPELIGGPGLVAKVTEPLRRGVRTAVGVVPETQRGLIPGMVVGDESMMSSQLREQMRVTGLTHLTAVSGTHVGIVLLAVLGLARSLRIRGYALPVIGVVALVGFVLLVRPEPSVLRAAVMGSVAVVGILIAGRRRSLPALATAVSVLVLADPWLAQSIGFILSVSATAGIIMFVPAWEKAMSWLPRPLALAVAVPVAAQVACTPALLSAFGQFSLASVPANMLAAPVVAPLMVLGLAATVVSPLSPALAAGLAWLAGWPAAWIAGVARWFARQPGAEFEWPSGAAGIAGGLLLAAAAVLVIPLLLRRPLVAVVAAAALTAGLLRVVPTPGWPPDRWIAVLCDVGQGDAVVLRAGPGTAVVVDTGPDPVLIRRCLDSLGIVHVPVLVLTHFHADHVDGVPGVLAGREVGSALVSPLAEPADGARQVARWLAAAGVPARVGWAGERWEVGGMLSFEVLWPRRIIVSSAESDPNNASVVLAAKVSGVRMLLTGDVEPLAQRALLAAEPGLRAEVLKVAHHGSRHQVERLLTGVGAELALIGVGENSHGHPDDDVLAALEEAGTDVRRTDEEGTFAVVLTADGELAVASR